MVAEDENIPVLVGDIEHDVEVLVRDMGIEDQKYVEDNNIMVFTIPDEDSLVEQLVEELKNHNSDVSEEEKEVV